MSANHKNNSADEISVNEIVIKARNLFRYLKSKWLTVLLFAILTAIAGVGYSMLKKPAYTASCTFVLDEGNKGALSQYAGVASLAGIDVNSGGGIFTGDNIVELYRSRLMLEKTLLTPVNFDGQPELLLERYVAHNHLREQWKQKDHINQISFTGDPLQFNRQQDSIITNIVAMLNKKVLFVGKPDKKLDIISVDVTCDDELFAKEFTDKLVETVNNFYTQTKTKKAAQNLQILQKQADSLRGVLHSSVSEVASANDAAPNANPLMSSLRVPSQKKQVDVQYNTVIYGEIIRNLEAAKLSLREETPLIQVIDSPVLPLSVERLGKLKAAVLGFIIGSVITLLYLTIKRIGKDFFREARN